MVTFSDDTVLQSLLHDPETGHGRALSDFVTWCRDNYLDINVAKTK